VEPCSLLDPVEEVDGGLVTGEGRRDIHPVVNDGAYPHRGNPACCRSVSQGTADMCRMGPDSRRLSYREYSYASSDR